MTAVFFEYEPYKGDMQRRNTGSLVAFETGEAVTYGLFNAQGRGTLFITPGTPVYEGMVIGCTNQQDDINVNVCKTKHLTNTRSSGSDDALTLVPVSKMSLEECLEFIADDELLEVTPKSLRIRKRILDSELRAKARFRAPPPPPGPPRGGFGPRSRPAFVFPEENHARKSREIFREDRRRISASKNREREKGE